MPHRDKDILTAAHMAHLTMLAAQVEDLDYQMRRAVSAARHDGLTWETIGHSLGVSRQAAQSRYAHDIKSRAEHE